MVRFKFEGCDTYVIKDDFVVIIDLEAEAAILTRLDDETGRVNPNKFVHFEIPLSLKTLHKIHTAENELDLLITILEG